MFVAARYSICLIVCTTLALIGCNSRTATVATRAEVKQVDPIDDLVESVRDEMRKSTDPAAYRRIVDRINNYLPRASAEHRPAAISADERDRLAKDFGLQPREAAEVARAEFTTLDGYYLDEMLLLRDVAKSLDVDNQPPVGRATAALAWVVRNLRCAPGNGPALPVRYVALRGAGTSLERTYLFLGLLRQLGVDAALIGDSGAGPEGVWAVGVLDKDQIYLFDARLGLPLPGPDGTGILTLAQAQTAADPFKALALDPKLPYDVTADRAKRAAVLVAAPLSALSPRMRFLQGVVGADSGRLSADLFAERDRFRHVVGKSNESNVRFWCPPTPDALPRLLFAFLPASEGGGDASQPERRIQFGESLLPLDVLPPALRDLQGEPGQRIRTQLLAIATMLEAPGRAHDLILRGQFQEATDQLVEVQNQAGRRPGNVDSLGKNAEEWANAARAFAADQSRVNKNRADPETVDRMESNKAIAERLWHSPEGPVGLIAYLLSDSLTAQATYLLGLCKQEEAERQAARPDATGANGPNWATAQMWWTRFLANYPNSSWAPAAKRNLARAQEASGQREAARTAYMGLAGSASTPLERLACRYWAEKLK